MAIASNKRFKFGWMISDAVEGIDVCEIDIPGTPHAGILTQLRAWGGCHAFFVDLVTFDKRGGDRERSLAVGRAATAIKARKAAERAFRRHVLGVIEVAK
jgi:hypothetical protein